MSFASFGINTQPKVQMAAMELGELTARLDGIKEAIDQIQVVFEPKIEVPPAQIAVEMDLTGIENALQDMAAKEVEHTHNVSVAAPQVTNNVHVTIGQELLYPLYSISLAGLLLAVIQVVGYFK